MLSRSPLFVKGIIIVGIPLLFEIFLFTTLLFLQAQYLDTLTLVTKSKQAIAQASALGRCSFAYMTNRMAKSFGFNNIAKFQSRKREIANLEEWLNDFSLEDNNIRRKVMPIINSVNALIRHADTLAATDDDFSQPSAPPISPMANPKLVGQLKTIKSLSKQVMDIEDELRAFEKSQMKVAENAISHISLLAKLINATIAATFVGNLLIALFSLKLFMSSIHTGFQHLIENMNRFKTGQPLSPQLSGNDEITQLDGLFHRVYSDLNQAQRAKQAYIDLLRNNFEQPVAAAKSYLQTIKSDDTLKVEARKGAERSERNLDRLLKLIDELLHLDKRALSKQGVELQTARVDLSDILKRSAESVSEFAAEKKVQIEIANTAQSVIADADKIVQVIVNLLSNAVKFSPANSIVNIHVIESAQQTEIQVIDKGRGVPLEKQAKIFDRFGQADVTDASEKGGTGLGLPICKEIVEAHGGSIGVSTPDGPGSIFWVKLPNNNS